MTLYHGTNVCFSEIDLTKSNPYKDFGKGFYLTPELYEAEEMAQRRVKLSKAGEPTILKYEFDEAHLTDGTLKALHFDKPSREWAEFILRNRYEETAKPHDYDVVIGPIANDGIAFQLERYVQGIISLDRLVEELTYRRLDTQYFFGTEKAVALLKQI